MLHLMTIFMFQFFVSSFVNIIYCIGVLHTSMMFNITQYAQSADKTQRLRVEKISPCTIRV